MDPATHILTRQFWTWHLFYFIYGLSFFLMGFAILIRARQGSGLRLGRRLPILAWFGLLHGANEWGYILLPVQAVTEGWQTLRGALVTGAHACLLAVSFTYLLAFGVNLLADTRGWPKPVRSVPLLCLAAWGLWVAVTFPGRGAPTSSWLVGGDVMARYLLAVPGSILSALAILAQGGDLAPLRHRPLSVFRVGSAVAFFLYTLAGGLLVPPASFFPARILNAAVLEGIGVPAPAPRIVSSILITVFIFRLLELYDTEEKRRQEAARARETVWREREKIRRDLHDGVVQSLYGLALGLEQGRRLLVDNPAAAARLDALSRQVGETIEALRGYLSSLHLGDKLPPEAETLIKERAAALLEKGGLKVSWRWRGNGRGILDGNQRDHFYHMINEIFSNIRRHAGADRVQIQVDLEERGLKVLIRDNGNGLVKAASAGQGLRNLRERAVLAGGWLELKGLPGRGTVVGFWLPYTLETGGEKG